MYERFSRNMRQIMQLANKLTLGTDDSCIGPGNVLLAMLEWDHGVGMHVLRNLSVDIDRLKDELRCQMPLAGTPHLPTRLTFSPLAKSLIAQTIHECRALNHKEVGTEHLLLALFQTTDKMSSKVIAGVGLPLDRVRAQVCRLRPPGHVVPDPEGL